MANLNKVMLIGRLTRDPEARTFSTGGKVAKFGFAVNNRKKNQATGQWEDEPVFLDVEIFNRGENTQADRVEQTLRKGQQIFIEGHLRMDNWTTQDGQKRSKLVVVVDNFQYLEARPPRASTPPRRSEPTYSGGNGSSYGGGFADESEPAEPSGRGSGQEDDIPF